MKRVCIIGNSHSGGLLVALRSLWKDEELSFEVYAIPGKGQPDLKVRNGRFFPAHRRYELRTTLESAKTDGLDLNEFDAILVSAVGMRGCNNQNLSAHVHPLGFARCFDWDCVAPESAPQPVSRALMRDIVTEMLPQCGPFQFCLNAVKLYQGPIFVQPTPRPAARILKDPEWALNKLYGGAARDVHSDFTIMSEEISKAALEKIAPSIKYLGFPDGTETEESFTLDGLSRGNDIWHMHADYGAQVLAQVRDALKSA